MTSVEGQIRKYAKYLFSDQESLAHTFYKSKTYQLLMKQKEGEKVFKEFVKKNWTPRMNAEKLANIQKRGNANIQSVGEKQFFYFSEQQIKRFVEHSFTLPSNRFRESNYIDYYIEKGRGEGVEKEFQHQWYPILKADMQDWKKDKKNKDLLAATKFYAEYNKTYKFDEYDSLQFE